MRSAIAGVFLAAVAVATGLVCALGADGAASLPEPRKTVIKLEIPTPEDDSAGSMIAADLDGDRRPELIVTAPQYLGAYKTNGTRLWSLRTDIRVAGSAETYGLPGHHGPGVQAGDVDGDGRAEVVFLDQDSTVHVLDGRSGREKWRARPPVPEGAERWEHVVIADFRGRGDRDLLLQATNKEGYRMGRYLAAYAAETLRRGGEPLWQTDSFGACAHNGARVADIDGDGRDEVLGPTILDHDGRLLCQLEVHGHIDSVYAADVDPDHPGLEVAMLEEGGNRVFLAGADGVLWVTDYERQEPQNAAVGRFDLTRPGLQIWCRSRYDQHQKPFVFDAKGNLIAHYAMDDVAPPGWTVEGVEVIWPIHWTGEEKQLAAAKERHKNGDVCVFDPISGSFLLRIPETAARLYVADVLGDWREEIVVWNGSELHIYDNPAPNPRPHQPRLWQDRNYRRAKTTWNYYSP